MDYEHALCNQGYCPGRRRTQEKQQQQQQGGEEEDVKVLLVDMSQSYDIYDDAEALTGDKGMWIHKQKKWEKPKITKLIPEYRHYDYNKPGYTKLKPVHRVYQQPPSPAFLVVVPEKHPWLKHPWLSKFGDKTTKKQGYYGSGKRKLRTRRRRKKSGGKGPKVYTTQKKKGYRIKTPGKKAPKIGKHKI